VGEFIEENLRIPTSMITMSAEKEDKAKGTWDMPKDKIDEDKKRMHSKTK
jgi:hypothetical protein